MWEQGARIPLENHLAKGFLNDNGTDPLKSQNYQDTNVASSVGSSSARQRNAIQMAFRWRANYGALLMVFGSSHQLTKIELDPSYKTYWIRSYIYM